MFLYAIGDIHGMSDHLNAMLGMIDADLKEHGKPAKIICLGDYVDRGPDSKGVIDIIINRIKQNNDNIEMIALMGNHEDMMIGEDFGLWIWNGGKETLTSYGIDIPKHYDSTFNFMDRLPSSHIHFLNNLRTYYQFGRFVFVHANAHPDWMIHETPKQILIWERKYNLFNEEYKYGYHVTHGHTPKQTIDIKRHQINIDTGCCFGGSLSAVRYDTENEDEMKFFQVSNDLKKRFIFPY